MLCAHLILHFIIFILFYQRQIKADENYGPYKLEFRSFGICKGVKASNLTEVTTGLDNLIGSINLTVNADFKLDTIKVRIRSIREKKGIVWNYIAKDPCKHFAYSFLLNQFFKMDNCIVKRGSYNLKVNFREMMTSVMGDHFFYGTFNTKTEVFTKKEILTCFSSMLVLSKKT